MNLFNKVKENAKRIADVLVDCKINIDRVITIKHKAAILINDRMIR